MNTDATKGPASNRGAIYGALHMKTKLPAMNTRISPLARERIHPADAILAMPRHCLGHWEHLPPADRRRNNLALENGQEVVTPFTDRNGVAFIVVTDAHRTCTKIKLPEEI